MVEPNVRAPGRVAGATMDDVADLAGVSRATVSRVLNGRVPVAEKTKERVLSAVNELGYVPNLAASQLAAGAGGGGGTGLVGLLLRDPRTPAYGLLLSEMQKVSTKQGLQLVTVIPEPQLGADAENLGLQRLLGLRVSGLFVATGVVRAEQLAPFLAVVPVVSVGRLEWHPSIHAVSYDEDAHATMLANRVADHGHRHVAVVVPDLAVSYAEHVRGSMIVRRLRERGVEAIEVPAATFGWVGEKSGAVVDLVRDGRVTAAMFTSDRRALHFLEIAQAGGIRAPDDVSVTGCDGVLVGLELIGLSTLRIPVESVAHRSAEVMANLLSDPHSITPSHELQRGSIVPGRTLSVPPVAAHTSG